MQSNDVSIIFGTVDRKDSVRRLVETIETHSAPVKYEIIVIDSGKDQSNFEYLSKKKNVIFYYDPVKEGFVKAYNKAAALATGQFIVWLNDDCAVTPGWLTMAIAYMNMHPEVGIGGIQFLDFVGTPKQNGPVQQTALGKYAANFGIVKRSIWEALDGFDESFHSYGGETDFCFKVLNMGLKVVPIPNVCINHFRVQDEHRIKVMNKHNKGSFSLLKAKWGNNMYVRSIV